MVWKQFSQCKWIDFASYFVAATILDSIGLNAMRFYIWLRAPVFDYFTVLPSLSCISLSRSVSLSTLDVQLVSRYKSAQPMKSKSGKISVFDFSASCATQQYQQSQKYMNKWLPRLVLEGSQLKFDRFDEIWEKNARFPTISARCTQSEQSVNKQSTPRQQDLFIMPKIAATVATSPSQFRRKQENSFKFFKQTNNWNLFSECWRNGTWHNDIINKQTTKYFHLFQ